MRFLLVGLLLASCGPTIQSATPEQVTIRYEAPRTGAEVEEMAAQACGSMGKALGERIGDTPMNPNLPGALVPHVATFRCV